MTEIPCTLRAEETAQNVSVFLYCQQETTVPEKNKIMVVPWMEKAKTGVKSDDVGFHAPGTSLAQV